MLNEDCVDDDQSECQKPRQLTLRLNGIMLTQPSTSNNALAERKCEVNKLHECTDCSIHVDKRPKHVSSRCLS
jgi:hypothetical protein